MPNYVGCVLDVSGDADDLDRFTNKARGMDADGRESEFALQRLIPMPVELGARSPPVTEGDPNWYDWRLENWGTKWDTDEVVLSKDKKGLHYCFCCAWSGPVQAIEQISAEFPALTFRLRHADEAMDWDEELLFRKGIVLERTAATFDIPATRQYWGCEPRCRNCGCDEDVCECSGLQELAAMTRD